MNFVAIIDPDSERRLSFINKIKPLIAPVEGLTVSTHTTRDLTVTWAAGSWTPVSQVTDEEGFAAVWGDAIECSKDERIGAKQLRLIWSEPKQRLQKIFDGYYLGLVYNPKSGVVIGADILGLFPVYYYMGNEFLIIGSSPELFRWHEKFHTELNISALVGILLMNGIVGGECLLKGIKRLNSGNLLIYQSGQKPAELCQYKIPISTQYFDLSFPEQVDLINKTVQNAIRRHVNSSIRHCLTLSGGLDSRMLGGYLKQSGVDVIALTEGVRTDFETGCAIKVATTLGYKQRIVDINPDKYWACAGLKVKWEHLANGFSTISSWGLYSHLRQIAPRVIAGYLGDTIIGGWETKWGNSFDSIFAYLNKWGFSLESLKSMFKCDISEIVQKKIESMKQVYKNYSNLEFQRKLLFFIYNRSRFHVGGHAWSLTFGAWPVLPFVDSNLLEIAGGLPFETLLDRKAQNELLFKEFPELAKLPIDRNSFETTPLNPSATQRLKRHIYGYSGIWSIGKAREIREKLLTLRGERRYYYRVLDFNNDGWQSIREQAEDARNVVSDIFDRNFIDEILPPAETKIKVKDGIIDSGKLKLLTGFMIWSKTHLT